MGWTEVTSHASKRGKNVFFRFAACRLYSSLVVLTCKRQSILASKSILVKKHQPVCQTTKSRVSKVSKTLCESYTRGLDIGSDVPLLCIQPTKPSNTPWSAAGKISNEQIWHWFLGKWNVRGWNRFKRFHCCICNNTRLPLQWFAAHQEVFHLASAAIGHSRTYNLSQLHLALKIIVRSKPWTVWCYKWPTLRTHWHHCCICVYVCMYVCMYLSIYLSIHPSIHPSMSVCLSVCMYVYGCICTQTSLTKAKNQRPKSNTSVSLPSLAKIKHSCLTIDHTLFFLC